MSEIIFVDHILLSVIGTAGGIKDFNNSKLDNDIFQKMISSADEAITNEFGLHSKDVILVSGGAAWGDHVAVELYKTGNLLSRIAKYTKI